MFKSLLIATAMLLTAQAQATVSMRSEFSSIVQAIAAPVETTALLDWTVGDTVDFNLSSAIINGSIHGQVREATTEGFWVQQDMDLGFAGKQKVEIHYDKNTGQVLALLVNGKKQTPPDTSDTTVIETKQDRVTVPKGTFDCLYAKLKDSKKGDITEAWINPDLIPIGGMIKSIAPSQFGAVTIELTNFLKQ